MQHRHIRFGGLQLFSGQDIGSLQTNIIFFIKEAFLLRTGHIQYIQLWKSLFQAGYLVIWRLGRLQGIINEIAWNAQFFR